jgi:Fe/S biogenesis protein NfuA
MVTALVRRSLGCAVNRKQELSDLQTVSRGPNWPSVGSAAEPRLGEPWLSPTEPLGSLRAPGGPVHQSGRLEGGRPDVEERRSDRLARRGALQDTAYLRLGGGCQGCGMATVTLGQGIEVVITGAVPEIVRVVDVTDHAAGTKPYFEPAKT